MKWVLTAFLLGIILFIGSSFFIEPTSIETLPPLEETPTLTEEKPIKIILVGDIMLDRGVEYMVERYGGGDFKFPFLKIADYLNEADIVFGNLEGPISDKGEKVGSIYSFRAEPAVIEGLAYAGFDILSLANNHAFDFGVEALEDTLSRLKEDEIDYIGAGLNESEAYSPIVKGIKDTKIAFLAYTNLGPESWRAFCENPGIAWISDNDLERVKNDIEIAKNQTDILIVSLHSGEEYVKEPTQFQISFAKTAIEAGANLVVDHHPHIVQRNEKYKDGWIFYSLGNFVFDQSFSEETMKGEMVDVTIEDKRIKEITPVNIKINEYFQPEIY